jgi:5-methylcytosine-specific restriction endonuclease McrA
VTKLYTLKLDAAWQPIEIIDAYKGFSLVFSGRAQVVEEYTQQACALFCFPSVIVLKKNIRKGGIQVPPSRSTVFFRDDYHCQYCGNKFMKHQLTLDHVIPKSRGGPKTWNNLVACCVPCNQLKGDKTPSEVSMELFKEPRIPSHTLWSSVEWMMRRHGRRDLPIDWKKFLGERYE